MTRVLVVEDEHTIAESIELYLRKEGYQTERAGDGLRALELWRAFRPDLIVLDIGLPELDGLEVLQTIRAEDSVPVIMLTARAEEIDELLDEIRKPKRARRKASTPVQKETATAWISALSSPLMMASFIFS